MKNLHMVLDVYRFRDSNLLSLYRSISTLAIALRTIHLESGTNHLFNHLLGRSLSLQMSRPSIVALLNDHCGIKVLEVPALS